MEIKDYIIFASGITGWIWAIIQFKLNRKYLKEDKVVQSRFEAYSHFMNKMDEVNLKIRTNPNVIYGIQKEFIVEILSDDLERINNSLLKLNDKLIEIVKDAIESMSIWNYELNKLKLVASDSLLVKITDFKTLIYDYKNDLTNALSNISSKNNLEENGNQFEVMAHDERGKRINSLLEEIEGIMRSEILYYKK